MKKIAIIKTISATLLAIGLTGCIMAPDPTISPSGATSRGDWGEDWPFTTNSGVLSHEGGGISIMTEGKTYALDPVARDPEVMRKYHLTDIDGAPIWATDPATGQRKSLDLLINDAQSYFARR